MNLIYKIIDDKGTRYEEEYKFLDKIAIRELHTFTVDMLNKFGTEEKLKEANNVTEILIKLLKERELLTDNGHQSFVDILLSASLLHNLFYKDDKVTTLFEAREKLLPEMKKQKIDPQVTEAILATIEGQLGEKTPVATVKPNPNTPTEMFSLAVWINKNFIVKA